MPSGADQYSNQNHYEALGIDRGAAADDVRSAYRLRSHMFHPDKYETYPEPLRSQLKAEAAKEFKKITAAYNVLRDPAKRAAHDRQLDAGWVAGRARAAGTRAQPAGRAPTRPAPARSAPRRTTVREAPAADAEDAENAKDGAKEEAKTRRRRAAPPPEPPRPRERDPLLVVRPDRLDFGSLAPGATKQLPLKISNAGGRTLFGEITSNRSWLSVNRKSFVSSSTLVFVSIDTSGLRPGEEYAGSLVVTTLNGGDQVVPVVARVSGKPEPILAGVPSLLDFGTAEAGSSKVRSVRLTNGGTGTLIGSLVAKGDWLAVSESRFRQNDFSFEVIASTAGLQPGEHRGEVLLFTNGGQQSIQATIEVAAPPTGGAMVRGQPAAGAPETPETADTPGARDARGAPVNGALSKEEQQALLRRIMLVEPETVFERDFLRRVVHLIRSGEPLAPGELAKIYEMEARKAAQQP